VRQAGLPGVIKLPARKLAPANRPLNCPPCRETIREEHGNALDLLPVCALASKRQV
jgi:hypothetical protein